MTGQLPVVVWQPTRFFNPCHGKSCYSTKRLAATIINERLRSHQRRHRPKHLRAYHCQACEAWHITSK